MTKAVSSILWFCAALLGTAGNKSTRDVTVTVPYDRSNGRDEDDHRK